MIMEIKKGFLGINQNSRRDSVDEHFQTFSFHNRTFTKLSFGETQSYMIVAVKKGSAQDQQ